MGTLELQAGHLELESILRAPLVVIADPVVAASGPAATVDHLGGAEWAILERPAGSILVVGNPTPDGGLFVWAGHGFLAVLADPDLDTPLATVGQLTVTSGRLVAGAPAAVAAWGADVDTGDGSATRARVHRGRERLGLIVVCHAPPGQAAVAVGAGAAAVTFPTVTVEAVRLPLAG